MDDAALLNADRRWYQLLTSERSVGASTRAPAITASTFYTRPPTGPGPNAKTWDAKSSLRVASEQPLR